jgi:hypothetical protein
MFNSINRTVFDIPLTWDRIRFEASRAKCRQARKIVEISVNGNTGKKIVISLCNKNLFLFI